MSKRPKVCVFCGATPLSKEHIWSEWTYKILPKAKGRTHIRGVIQTGKANPRIKGFRHRKQYQGEVNSIQIRAVCRSKNNGTNSLGATGCNNGWMGDQDQEVMPILSPLILGQPALLTETAQLILSRWLVTKFMVAEFSEPEDVVSTQDERTGMLKSRTIPPHWRIWIARQSGILWRTGYSRHSSTLGTLDESGTPIPPDGSRTKNTQLVTIAFGFLLVHAFYSRVPEMRWEYGEGTLFRIHPFTDILIWPPSSLINGAQIDSLDRRYDRFLSELRWAE